MTTTAASQGIENAIRAYSAASRGANGQDTGVAQAPAGDEFAGLVRDAIDTAIQIGEKSERMSIAGLSDRADIGQVVTAVAEAEVTLQTVVTIRDRMIDAYRDIIRMPI